MKHLEDYAASTEELGDGQVAGAVLLVFLVLLNVILVLDLFGYLSIA